jgi:hypothetical protein
MSLDRLFRIRTLSNHHIGTHEEWPVYDEPWECRRVVQDIEKAYIGSKIKSSTNQLQRKATVV